MKFKSLYIQLAIVGVSIVLSNACIMLLTGLTFFGKKVLDINLHDTYFVINIPWQILITPGLILIITIFLFKETYNHFTYRFNNLILLTAMLILNIFVFEATQAAVKFISTSRNAVWTIYPPLSALPKHGNNIPDVFALITYQVLHAVQIMLLLLFGVVIVITAFKWRMNKDIPPKIPA